MVCKVKSIEHLKKFSIRLAKKHPDLHLLDKIKQRLDTLAEPANLNSETTLAIAVSLQSPTHLDGLQEKDPPFQAWKKASYDFLCKEFGQENLVYLHLNQDKPIPAIHCIFVPIQSNQLLPQVFVGTSAQEQGYLDRYQTVLDRLFEQAPYQTRQEPSAHTRNQQHKVSSPTTSPRGFHAIGEDILDRAKREINLVQFAMDELGHIVNKKKSCKRYVVLDHGKGTPKIMVYQHERKMAL